MRPTTEGAVSEPRSAVSLDELEEKKAQREPIVMVTAYDYPSAQAIQDSDAVDLVLAGDTGAEMMLGYSATSLVPLEEMIDMTAAVRRGLRAPLLIGDLPFGTYETSDEQAIRTAQRLVKKGGADVVKLERAGSSVSRIHAIVAAGIPVMGHLGLTPQSETALGGRRAQARNAEQATRLMSDAIELERAGAFAIVFEAVPAPVAEAVTKRLTIPTIGIGAGAGPTGKSSYGMTCSGSTTGAPGSPRRTPSFAPPSLRRSLATAPKSAPANSPASSTNTRSTTPNLSSSSTASGPEVRRSPS